MNAVASDDTAEGTTPAGTVPRQRPGRRTAGMVGLILLALILPRALTLYGITTASIMDFADMADHLYFLDVVGKERALPEAQQKDPFLLAFPETRPRMLAIQWPPGLYHLASLWSPLLGTGSLWTTQVTNLLFNSVLLLSVVGLGAALGGPRVGLWGALLTALSPPLVASTWFFSLDYPLLAMVLLGLYLLWRSRQFSCLWASLAFGAVSALGSFVKPTYAVYLAGPALVYLALGLRCRRPRWAVALRCLLGAALSLGLVLVLYRPDWTAIGHETRVHFLDRHLPGAATDPWTLEWFASNLKMAAANFPWPLLLLAAPGIALLHLRRAPGRWLLLSYLWASYVFLTLLANKMERYIQPVYPVFCLLAAWWLAELVPRRWQRAALSGVTAAFAGMLLFTYLVKPIPWLPEPRDAIEMDSAFHPFRYEFIMPDQERLARLRAQAWDSECDLEPMLRQIDSMLRHEDGGSLRPLGAIYLRDLPRAREGHPPMAFRRLLPALTLRHPERYIVVANLHVMPDIPVPLLNIPTLLVLHGAEVDPGRSYPQLRVLARRQVTMNCLGLEYGFFMMLARPIRPLGE